MKKIFIDTNKYLDFYRYKEENLEILNNLSECNKIIITEQIIDEFNRNRNKELNNLKTKIHELNCKLNLGTYNIEPIGIYVDKIKAINLENSKKISEIKKEISDFEDFIDDIYTSTEKDIILNTFLKIIENKQTIVLKHDDDCYNKAIKRNNLGGIPRSEKNGFRSLTVCDEYIWETLLQESKYDLCFITRDQTYLDNQELLKDEYRRKTGKEIIFTDTISDGLTYLGTEVSKYASEVDGINTYELKNEYSSTSYKTDEIRLNDIQKEAFDTAVSLAKEAVNKRKKKILIVNASTGCGKTTLAANLLIEFIEESYKATFVSPSGVSRNIFYSRLKDKFRNVYINNLISASSSFIESDENAYDCLIVDDAQRLKSKSGLFKNLGENQIKEIIRASYFSIFFVDKNQRISFDDIGSRDLIEEYGKEYNADIYYKSIEIPNYQNNYRLWINNILNNVDETKYFDDKYDFKIFENPTELRKAIIEKNKMNKKSRILAGYCWDWKSEGRNNSEIFDIVIPEYNFKMSWNVVNNNDWGKNEESISEVGSVYAVQGKEFDYVGVIIGNDMRFENNKITTDYTKHSKSDSILRGINKKLSQDREKTLKEIDELIINSYRILLTRGKKGCYIYCMDKKLEEYLKNKLLLNQVRIQSGGK